ncbi:MAG TPA: PHB depolymerase family esterase [Burkholderiaceae bacterium]|nr:PHB depolymerase family esterase [Burkholderiaceae bacterium]
MRKWSFPAILAAISLTAGLAFAAPASLPAFGGDPHQTSVSGLSSGAFMAVQLQVAYSDSIVGAGVVAGGPYYCAANSVLFTSICMGQMPFFPPNPKLMVDAAKEFAKEGLIDPLGNLGRRRIYVFSGTRDSVVRQPAVDATVSFFQMVGVTTENLRYVNSVPAGHAVVTPSYGNDCAANSTPYINQCAIGGDGYDQVGTFLQHIYGPLNPRVKTPRGQIISFDQKEFASTAAAMADVGYLYVPPACAEPDAHCKVHVAIHGCDQSVESIGRQFYTDTGYNNWADTNGILVLYPQVNKSWASSNPMGCWDWWGYTGTDYAYKRAPQMKAISTMVNRLTEPRRVDVSHGKTF